MPEYGFSLNRIFPYKDGIFDSVLICEYMGQRKPVFLHIFRSVFPNFSPLLQRQDTNFLMKKKQKETGFNTSVIKPLFTKYILKEKKIKLIKYAS